MISRSKQAEAGFTLLELLVVLAIIGLAGGLLLAGRSPTSPATAARMASDELAAALRLARAEAIAGNRPVGVTLDLARRRYRVGTAAEHVLPVTIQLTLLTARSEIVPSRQGRIRFNPDGSSTGARVDVIGGARKLSIRVDWLTGRVALVHGS